MMAEFPKGLGNVDNVIKRFKSADKLYNLWRSLHQEAYDFAAPSRNTFRFYSPGQNKNRHIFDSTAVIGLQQFANRVQSALMPPWQQWATLVSGSEVPEESVEEIDKGLEEATKRVFAALNHSNFYTEVTPTLVDLGIGTGGIEVEETAFTGSEVMSFTNVPLAELYIEKPPGGPIKNSFRQQKIKASDIKTVWPTADLSNELEKLAKDPTAEEVTLINAHLFNKEDERFYQLIIHEPSKKLLFSQGFDTQRRIISRWHVVPGEGYGRGPILQQLADIRTVNKVKQFILENAAIQMAGVYTGVDDGVFNPHTVRIAPGSIIPVSSNSNSNPTMQALPRAGDIGLGGLVLEDLQANIRKALLIEPLGDIQDPVRSATEIMIRTQEDLRDSGASFGRQRTEFIEPLLSAVVDILVGVGQLPALNIDGKEITIRYASPMAKAEDLEDFQNSQVWLGAVGQLPQEIVAASVKVEDLPKYWQETLNVPADLIRNKTERESLLKPALQAIANPQQQGAVPDDQQQ